MDTHSAVVFLPNDMARTGLPRPTMLLPVLGSPLLAWLADALRARGVDRFFLVCRSEFLEEAKACFPASAELSCASDQNVADLLHVFLSTAGDEEA